MRSPWALGGVAILLLASGALQVRGEEGAGGGNNEALHALIAEWDGLKNIRTLEAHFTCEKDLAALDTPLRSAGRIWIQKGVDGEEGAVRFSTEKPYISELILADGKVYARSQHESEWTTTNQSRRPGLTAVMSQLGGWSTGNAEKLGEFYTVTRSTAPVPAPDSLGGTSRKQDANSAVFVLTPANKDLAKAVKQVTIAIDPATHYLQYIEIETRQDDRTRYWFTDVRTNVPLPPNIFKPGKSGAAEGTLVPEENHR